MSAARNRDINALEHWVKESTKTAKLPGNTSNTILTRLTRLIAKQSPITHELILYRAHSPDTPYIRAGAWFATSTDEAKVRRQHITTGADCCLFKIHVLPGIKVLVVDDVLKADGRTPTGYDESEVIVEGTGEFYTSPTGFTKGTTPLGEIRGVQVFETYYGPIRKQTSLNADTFLSRLDEDEYNMIDSVNELKAWPGLLDKGNLVTTEVYEEVFRRIKEHLNKRGGKINTNRRMRHRTRRLKSRRRLTRGGGARATRSHGPVAETAAAATKTSSSRLFGDREVRTNRVSEGGETFDVKIILSPVKSDGAEIKRIFKDNRLEISEANINGFLEDNDYEAIIEVRNIAKNDRAIASIQYAMWCTSGEKVWIHDISRIATERGTVSPTKIVMDTAKRLTREKRKRFLYLMVDEHDKTSKPADGVWKKLTGIYSDDYGFSVDVSGCAIESKIYTIMKAPV
jgi:hypothetical protein